MNYAIRISTFIFLLSLVFVSKAHLPSSITITSKRIDELTYELYITFSLAKKDCLYKDFISFSAAHPCVHISPWKTDNKIFPYYDPLFKSTKEVFKDNKVTISCNVTANTVIDEPVYVYGTYYQRLHPKIKHFCYTVHFSDDIATDAQNPSLATLLEVSDKHEKIAHTKTLSLHNYCAYIFTRFMSYVQSIAITPITHFIFIITILFLCISFFYLLKKRLLTHPLLIENIRCLLYCSSTFVLYYLLYLFSCFTSPCISMPLITAAIFSSGVTHIKKSTSQPYGHLRALYTCWGGMSIIASLVLLGKTIQLFIT